jgi:hypothetical protein
MPHIEGQSFAEISIRFNSLYYRDHIITINILYRTSTYIRYNYLRADLHLSNMMIDVDGSPTGYVAWYNHHTEASRIRPLRTALKNDKFGVQRMEMLAIYFALADNYNHFKKIGSKSIKKGRRLIVRIRNDSKSTVDQLQGISEIRDTVLQRICTAIKKLCVGMTTRYNNTTLIFNYLERTRNIAGLLLEQRRRKQREKMIFLNQYNNNFRIRGVRALDFKPIRSMYDKM